MADSTGVYDNRIDGNSRKRTMYDHATSQPRTLFIASDSEKHAKSRRTNSHVRSKPPDIRADMPANPYERRPRRKTREDRYEPKGNPEGERTLLPDKTTRKKKIFGKRVGSCRIGEKFCAENIRSGRLTVNFTENLGIFKKGKTSDPVHCSDIPYLNFSETKFLSKEPQMLPDARESMEETQQQNRPGEDEAVASRFKKPLPRSQEPRDATLSNDHNSESPPARRLNKSQISSGQELSQRIEDEAPSHEGLSAGDRASLFGTGTFKDNEYPGSSFEKSLFDSLRNCDQLAIPYEEYKPTFLSGFHYTLEDLKCLCSMRGNLQPQNDAGFVENTKTNPERSFGAEDSLGNHELLSLVPGLTDVTEDRFLDYILDIEHQLAEDATCKFVVRAVNPGELDTRKAGAFSGPTTDSNSDLKNLLSFNTSDLTHLTQYGELSGDISRFRAVTLGSTGATKQAADIESSFLDGVSLPGGIFSSNIDGQLLPMPVTSHPHDETTPFWAIEEPLRVVSQNANLHQSGLGNVPERRFWRRHKLY